MSSAVTIRRLTAPEGFTARWWSTPRGDRAVQVEHTATGARGKAAARYTDTALAAALRLCRARMAMERHAQQPLPLVRDVDATTPEGAAALRAMADGELRP